MKRRRFVLRWVDALSRQQKRYAMAAGDFCLVAAAFYAAVAFRFGDPAPAFLGTDSWWLVLALPALTLPAFWACGLYRMIVRHMSPHVAYSVIRGVTASAAMLAVLMGVLPSVPAHWSIVPVYWALALLGVGGSRFLVRGYLQSVGNRGANRVPVVIYGAGSAGVQSAATLLQGNEYRPVAFVDDDASLHGSEMHGVRVHSPAELGRLVRTMGVTLVLLAMPSISHGQRREIIERLEPLPVTVKTLPTLPDLLSGAAGMDELRDVEVEDLLGRDPVEPDRALLEYCVRGKVVLVTGAGGSIGAELCRQILRLGPAELLLLDSSEFALYEIHRELASAAEREALGVNIQALLGSVLDRGLLQRVMGVYGVDSVYHAAAYKHVPIVEQNVVEGVRNNVLGTYRCAQAAMDNNVSSFVLVSTDKAVRPTNVMGASKRMAELVLQGMATEGAATRFTMVRFGNVLGSSGSVVPLFREQISRGGPVTVTDAEVVRYFMTITEASELVLQAGSMGQGGDVFVLNIGQPVKILNLARRMVHLMGREVRDQRNPDGDISIEFTGLRPGEKIREELLIGENVSATQHPMILRAEEDAVGWETMVGLLQKLESACEAYDCAAVRDLLQRAVREYSAEGEIVDHLWQSSAGRSTTDIPTDSKLRRIH